MHDDEPRRWLWIEETAAGPFTVAQMYEMARSEEIGPTTLFWSDRNQQWFPLTGAMFDIEPSRLDQMVAAGIKKVKVLSSGEEECEACATLSNKVFPISAPPALPPSSCTCVPWCRLVIIAVD